MKNKETLNALKDISDKLHKIIKILSVINNEKLMPIPWLDLDSQEKAKEIKAKNPEMYDSVCEILKLFLCAEQ